MHGHQGHDPATPEVHRFRDTCNVWVIACGEEAVAVDFGAGEVLDHLDELGVRRLTDVVVTHHHRDQVQGLARAAAHGARIWAPPVERALIDDVERMWRTRALDNYYDLREDRFSLLENQPVAGTADEYRWRAYGRVELYCLPTPGHTVGSVSYLARIGGRLAAFTGDLVYGPGKVWSLAATQWSYIGVEGLAATMSSCHELQAAGPQVLYPSHGEPMEDPPAALAPVIERMQGLVDLRHREPWDLRAWYERPWEELTPHLLRNRTSIATTYALLSDDGAALLVDFGYDRCAGVLESDDRSAKRPLLASLRALRSDHGVDRVEVVVPTHYHDDHVAGFNLLRDVEGTRVWSLPDIAGVLEDPKRFDLPCLWYEPIPVDVRLEAGRAYPWHEYELTLYPLPGHTLYAAAILFEVDGLRVLATGDQQTGEWDGEHCHEVLNFQYKNGFRIDDYVDSAALYRRLAPDLLISGHWRPRVADDAYLAMLEDNGAALARLHRQLLPLEELDFGAGGYAARIEPYQSHPAPGRPVSLTVTVRNPYPQPETAVLHLVAPAGWLLDPPVQKVALGAGQEGTAEFLVQPPGDPVDRVRVAVDVTVGETAFGQQAEALVTVRRPHAGHPE